MAALRDGLPQLRYRRKRIPDDNGRSLNFSVGFPGGDVSLLYRFDNIGRLLLQERRSFLNLGHVALLRRDLVSEFFNIAADIDDIVSEARRLIDESRNQIAVSVSPGELENIVKHRPVRHEVRTKLSIEVAPYAKLATDISGAPTPFVSRPCRRCALPHSGRGWLFLNSRMPPSTKASIGTYRSNEASEWINL